MRDTIGVLAEFTFRNRKASVYYPRRHRTLTVVSIVTACVLAAAGIGVPWGWGSLTTPEAVVWNVLLYFAIHGALRRIEVGGAYKCGWMDGRGDLVVTLRNHAASGMHAEEVLHRTLEDGLARSVFVLEGLGLNDQLDAAIRQSKEEKEE